MKFKFKVQDYQTKAVQSVIDVLKGQPYNDHVKYTRDLGIRKKKNVINYKDAEGNEGIAEKVSLFNAIDSELASKDIINDYYDDIENSDGFENAKLLLTDEELLKNIKHVQSISNIKESNKLVKHLGRCSLDIEMETGTGKTYVYLKTIFELNKNYGFSKFIVVVPSIAIREGVKKTFEITEEHFMETYHKKARYFIYDSKHLNDLDNFSKDSNINVMIINSQAFNTRGKDARRIYEKLDEFQSRKPIDVIAANRPILIIDEPQKLGGKATQESLKLFNPLFCLNYSATHKEQHNLIYVLDALDAYNERLVKKIEVKGFEVKNFRGTEKYLYLDEIIVSSKKPPMARIELEIKYNNSINRESRIFDIGDNLYVTSNNMEQYKENFVINEINPIEGTVTFTNGLVITKGEIVGDISEKDMRRIQIRETIASHFEKEEALFNKGMKTLSLFFIDEVAKYRVYDENGVEKNSEYAQIFNEYITLLDTPYIRYLKSIDAKDTHKGYFSIDKKTKRVVDSLVKGKGTESDDVSAYDLILKNKERLLSFEEPTRFIFSHSALREGWDNPNVFQICTLKDSAGTYIKRRQEIGRGLRLCVDQSGERVNDSSVNTLTVMANESYAEFVNSLQKELQEDTGVRFGVIEKHSFANVKRFDNEKQEEVYLGYDKSEEVFDYLMKNDYIDKKGNIQDKLKKEIDAFDMLDIGQKKFTLENTDFQEFFSGIVDELNHRCSVYEIKDASKKQRVKLNKAVIDSEEFVALWEKINTKTIYSVNFDSDKLIENCVKRISIMEKIQAPRIISRKDKVDITRELGATSTLKTEGAEEETYTTNYLPDIITELQNKTNLTRKTVISILVGSKRLDDFKRNPQKFIEEVVRIIRSELRVFVTNGIKYEKIDDYYSVETFNSSDETLLAYLNDKVVESTKSPYDYTVCDSKVEERFAKRFENDPRVKVYVKLPNWFKIDTPLGNYNPDWAVVIDKNGEEKLYFVIETKGKSDRDELRPEEKAKIVCAEKHFEALGTEAKFKAPVSDVERFMINV